MQLTFDLLSWNQLARARTQKFLLTEVIYINSWKFQNNIVEKTIEFILQSWQFRWSSGNSPFHGRTSHFYNEGLLQEFLPKNYFLRPYHKDLTDLAGHFWFWLRRESSFGQFWQMENTLSLRKHQAPV